MPQATFTFRVDEDIKNAFNQCAQENDRSASQLLRDFMRQYISEASEQDSWNSWFKTQVELGQADAKAGRVSSHEEVEARAQKRRETLIARRS